MDKKTAGTLKNVVKYGGMAAGVGVMFTPFGAAVGLGGLAAGAVDMVGGTLVGKAVDGLTKNAEKAIDKSTDKPKKTVSKEKPKPLQNSNGQSTDLTVSTFFEGIAKLLNVEPQLGIDAAKSDKKTKTDALER